MGSGASRAARRSAAGTAALAVLACGLPFAGAAPAAAADRVRTVLADDDVRFQVDDTSCSFPSDVIKGTPWSLQRVVLDQLWQDTRGKGVKVAVIDTGVDTVNAQLKTAVANGKDYLHAGGNGKTDKVGHGTKVAGIIAARKLDGTGFVGLAPEATIIPIRQNDDQGSGNVGTMMDAIRWAASQGAKVINISQDTASKMNPAVDAEFRSAIEFAQSKDALIVAAAKQRRCGRHGQGDLPGGVPRRPRGRRLGPEQRPRPLLPVGTFRGRRGTGHRHGLDRPGGRQLRRPGHEFRGAVRLGCRRADPRQAPEVELQAGHHPDRADGGPDQGGP